MKKIILSLMLAVSLMGFGCVDKHMTQPLTIIETSRLSDGSCLVRVSDARGNDFNVVGQDCERKVGEVWLKTSPSPTPAVANVVAPQK